MRIHIKNMVCDRCLMAVRQIFEKEAVQIQHLELGLAVTAHPLTQSNLNGLETGLQSLGFEILKDAGTIQNEQVRNLLIKKINTLDISEDFRISEYLTAELHKDFSSISRQFSALESCTIEKYFIAQKIEKVKELLSYEAQTLSEIAAQLGYRTVQHLSAQFRSVAGYSPTEFKKLRSERTPINLL